MKKIFSTLCMALMAVAVFGQDPVITFERTEHDFGKINEADGRVSTVFEFKNEGMTPLILSNVRASCGCTTPTWTKEPIEPGQSGSITVTYNPNGRPGRFQKTVTITSNASEPTMKVYIKGEVIPKPAKPENVYRIEVGALHMKAKELELGSVYKGKTIAGELEYANLSSETHTVGLEVKEPFLIHQTSLVTIQPNETGKFLFLIDTKETKLYGVVEADAYVVIDGKKNLSEPYRLHISANIIEDFSQLTVEDKQQAPIIETASTLDLGETTTGKVLKGQLEVKNLGANPLEIRRVYSSCEDLRAKSPKAVKSGKKGIVNIELNAKDMKPGKYTRDLQVITNDYEHPVKRIKVTWTITE